MTITWPTVTVEISFTSDSVKAFVQRDLSTAATWTDVTAYVLAWGYSRGRQRQLGRAEAGTGYLVLDNADGRFDPENSSSPYYGNYGTGVGEGMRPGKHVRIEATYSSVTYSLLYMFVTDWTPTELGRSGAPTVRVGLADHIAWLARTKNNVITADAQAPWEQIEEILNDEDVPAAFQLLDTSGEASLTATSGANDSSGNPWSVIQSYADSEEGSIVFVNGAGQYVYHDHARRYGADRSIIVQAVFDNGSSAPAGAVPYVKVDYTRDTNDLYAQFLVTPSGITTQSANNPNLIDRYYTRTASRSTRHKFAVQGDNMAERLQNRMYALWADHSLAQHTSLTVEAGGSTTALWPKVLGLEISDLIKVTERLYPGARERTIPSFIEGMQVDVDRRTESWKAVYRLSRALSAYHWIIGGKGVAFPTSPVTNDLFFRTDLGLLCFYDGSQWVTANEYEMPFTPGQEGNYGVTTAPANLLWAPRFSSYNVILTRAAATGVVVTTNNGSNYWTITLYSDSASIWSFNTSGWTAGTATNNNNISLGSTVYGPSLYFRWRADSKTGTPGALTLSGALKYRLVVP